MFLSITYPIMNVILRLISLMLQSRTTKQRQDKTSVFGKKLSEDNLDSDGRKSPTSPFNDELDAFNFASGEDQEPKGAVFEQGVKLIKKSGSKILKLDNTKNSTSSPEMTSIKRPSFRCSFMKSLKNSVVDAEPEEQFHPAGMFAFSQFEEKSSEESSRRFSNGMSSEDSNSIICSQNPTNLRGRKLTTSFNFMKNKSISPLPACDESPNDDSFAGLTSISDNANDGSIIAELRKELQNKETPSSKKPAIEKKTSFEFDPTDFKGFSENSIAKKPETTIKETQKSSESRNPVKTPDKVLEGLRRKRKRLRSLNHEDDEDTTPTEEVKVTWGPDSVSKARRIA